MSPQPASNQTDETEADTSPPLEQSQFDIHRNLRSRTQMPVQDAAATQHSPRPDHIAGLRTKDATLAESPTLQRKTTRETEIFLQNRVVRDSHDSGHKPNITESRTSDVGPYTESRSSSRLWVKSLEDSGNSVPLVARYEPASEQSLIASSAVNRLGLRVLPNKPTGRTTKTSFGILECHAFVSITIESPLPGNSRLETFNVAVAEDWLVASQGVELLAGRRIIAKLQELGVNNPDAISDRRSEVSLTHHLLTISETSSSSITERDDQRSLYYSCKDVQHQRATGLSQNLIDRDGLSLGSSEGSTHLPEESDRDDPFDWNDISSASWPSESDRKTSTKSETLSEFGRTSKLQDEEFGERPYNGNGPVYESPPRGLEEGKHPDWINLNTARVVRSDESNDDHRLDHALAEKTKSKGNLPSVIIPRTPQCFQTTKGSHRERIWGLHAREHISAMMVLMYAVLAFMPSLAFCFVYWFEIVKYTPMFGNKH